MWDSILEQNKNKSGKKKSPDENGIQEEKRNSHKVQGSIFLNHFEKKQQQKRRGSLESWIYKSYLASPPS